MSHLHTNHLCLYQEAMKSGKIQQINLLRFDLPAAQSTLQESVEHAQRYEQKGQKMEGTHRFDYTLYAEDCLPINVVEGAGFKKMINAFDSRYEIPSWNHFSIIAILSLCASVK